MYLTYTYCNRIVNVSIYIYVYLNIYTHIPIVCAYSRNIQRIRDNSITRILGRLSFRKDSLKVEISFTHHNPHL